MSPSLTLSLLLAAANAPVSSPPDDPEAPESSESTGSSVTEAVPHDRPVIVVSVHAGTQELLASAMRAVNAHSQGGSVDLLIEQSPIPGGDLRAHMRNAQELASRHGARGVFWIDLDSEEEFLLYLFEPEGLRVLVRRIPTSPADQIAAIESLGVIVGSSSEAIAAGETIGMTPVDASELPPEPETETEPGPETEPPPTTQAPTTADESSAAATSDERAWQRLRLSLAYAGTSYAPNVRWQSGASLAASVAVAPRLYVGLDYTQLAAARVNPHASVHLENRRHPIALHFGFHQPMVSWLALDAELAAGLTIDAWRRLDASDRGVRAIGTGAAWLALRFDVWRGLSLDVAVGAEVAFNDFSYSWSCPENEDCPADRTAIDPDQVRGRVRTGLSYRF